MKNKFIKIISLLTILSILPIMGVSAAADSTNATDFRGVWVATVLNIDYPSKTTTDSEKLKSEAIKILNNAQATGFNAVFLQVRPASDALYKSEYFPWSKYLTGKQGLAPKDNFDPLAFWIVEAHKRGIQLHAWINPYRVTKTSSSEYLDPSNPAKQNPGWVVKYSDGNLYFNPGIPDVRKYIIDGILEIIQNYDIDGIHFDDYFYPGRDFNDKAAFKKYGASFKNVDDWRRGNVTTLIHDLSGAIKSASPKIQFGISPFGIWANKNKNSLGSDTNGMQSYYDHYADTRKWVKDGIIDYIAPQIYWNIGYSVADYSKLLSWWSNIISGTNVKLYIGQASYKSGNSDSSSPWYGVSEIEKQLRLNEKTPEVDGSIFYNYGSLADCPALSAVVKAIYEQRDGAKAKIPVSVARPSKNIQTSYDKYYLNGASDPGNALYLNGKEVAGRSSKGYFGVLVNLSKGANTFTLSQKGSYVTRSIYRKSPASDKMGTADIIASSVYPGLAKYRAPGDKITLSCKAPIGSKVSVKLNGKSYNMNPSSTSTSSSGIYPCTYSYTYTIPKYSGTPRMFTIGAPVYTMNYKGTVKSRTAPDKIGVIMNSYPYYAKVLNSVIDSYQTPTTVNGASYELYKGMIDYITGISGDYVRLSIGQWVKKSDVTIYSSKSKLNPGVKKAVYSKGVKWDSISLDISSSPAAVSSFNGSELKLSISSASSYKLPVLPSDSLFTSVSASKRTSGVEYSFKLKPDQTLEGYYIQKTSAGFTLYAKRHFVAAAGTKPLKGFKIMLDPGHGGSDSGAIGPLGTKYPEKSINLKSAIALKSELEGLGATVLITRTTDKYLSLQDRLAASRQARPDMYLSIHANSAEDNVDLTKYNGFGVYYREALASQLTDLILNNTVKDLSRSNQGTHVRDFYVVRGTWCPSILIESGFVPNPNEFQWLTDASSQAQLAKSLSQTIVGYFR